MGVGVLLVDYGGNRLTLVDEDGAEFDAADNFDRVLPDQGDESFPYLRFVDPYGATMFNKLQMPALLSELERLIPLAQSQPERRGLARARIMARACRDGVPHLQLRLVGD